MSLDRRDDTKPVYEIPVVYEMYGTYRVRANSLEEAILQAADFFPYSVPNQHNVIDDSLRLQEWNLNHNYPAEWKEFVAKHGEEFGLKSYHPKEEERGKG